MEGPELIEARTPQLLTNFWNNTKGIRELVQLLLGFL